MHLELAVRVWHSGLTIKLSADIERVQRVAITIILGQHDIHYIQACTQLVLKPLFIRRQELCERFVLKTFSPDSRHSDMFQLEKNGTHFTHCLKIFMPLFVLNYLIETLHIYRVAESDCVPHSAGF